MLYSRLGKVSAHRSFGNNKNHSHSFSASHFTPPCSPGAIWLPSVVGNRTLVLFCCGCCSVSFVSLVRGTRLILPKCVQLRVLFCYGSWILSFLNPKWSWVLNKVILKLQCFEFKGVYCPAEGLGISEVSSAAFL